MAGIYIHIPFCGQFCTYCNFYSVTGGAYREKFIQALQKEIHLKKNNTEGASTVYFGGGTPSVLSPSILHEILDSVKIAFGTGGSSPAEITIEVNPDDITPEYAKGLKASGFNRVSMGVQSFIDEHLAWMNRRHRADDAVKAYLLLREAGFENISLDLIFGYGLLSDRQWEYNLNRIITLSPEHVSAYQMSVEPGSGLSALLRRGEYTLPDDTVCAAQYRQLQRMLTGAGYEQYEVSNFARPGFRSRHNSSYWNKSPYLGLGPSAHSFDGKIRYWNTDSIKRYCAYYLACDSPFSAENLPAYAGGFEILSGTDIFHESLMLGLRTAEGVDLSVLDTKLLAAVLPRIKQQVRLGNLILKDNRYMAIPAGKLFISDSIIRELF